MRRMILGGVFIILFFALLGIIKYNSIYFIDKSEGQIDIQVKNLDGIYDFKSRAIVLSKPEKVESHISFPEWKGTFIFKDGFFSYTLMKDRRYYSTFPKYYGDLGYESYTGTYVIENDMILLNYKLSLNPYEVGKPAKFQFIIRDNELILIEELLPHRESLAEGKRTISLHRVK